MTPKVPSDAATGAEASDATGANSAPTAHPLGGWRADERNQLYRAM
jgi:hypothetical protein